MISIFPCHFQAASRLFSFLIALPEVVIAQKILHPFARVIDFPVYA